MNLRTIRTLTAVGALLIPVLTAATASAQEYDRARFRGGVNLEGGVLAVPGVVNVGIAGLQGQLGAQINNNWGVYAIPNLDFAFGKLTGVGIGAGALVDYTFTGLPIGVGIGPEVGAVAAFGGTGCATQTGCTSISGFGGLFYGARARFAYYPVIVREGFRRRALAIGLDFRFLAGAFGSSEETSTTVTAKVTQVAVSPMITIGYAAF
jgi:hypothetical protein